MRSVEGRGAFGLFAQLVRHPPVALIAGALLGCGGHAASTAKESRGPAGQAATVENTESACSAYADQPDLYGHCLGQKVVSLTAIDDVSTVCKAAGTWQNACHQAWVSEQERMQRHLATEQLLAGCGPNQDCVFNILDTHPIGDIFGQLGACKLYASKFQQDCDRHALYRWAVETADPKVAEKLLDTPNVDPELIGEFVGTAAACRDTGVSCGSARDRVNELCRSRMKEYQADPGRCPPLHVPPAQVPPPTH